MEHATENSLTPPRDVIVAFRLTQMEAAHVDAAAAALKNPRRRADFCRAVALHAARQRVPEPAKPIRLPPRRLPALDTRLLSKTLAELGKVGSNVNQLARVANSTGALPTTAALTVLAREITEIRDAIVAALHGGAAEEAAS